MCFTLNQHDDKELTADQDVPCFKFLKHENGMFYAPHYNSEYKLDTTTTIVAKGGSLDLPLPLTRLNVSEYEIHEGLHSNRTYESCKKLMQRYIKNVGGTINSFLIVKFVIPSGTKYYHNETENVSLELRFVEQHFVEQEDFAEVVVAVPATMRHRRASGYTIFETWDSNQWNNTCVHSNATPSWFWGTKICDDCGCHLHKD